MGDDHAKMLEEQLWKVEGGKEVLNSRPRELRDRLAPDQERDLARWSTGRESREEERAGSTPYGFIRPGVLLSTDFWDLPMPEDPEASVRRAVEEDRRR